MAIDLAAAVRITDTPAWAALEAHHETVRDLTLRDLFRDDPERAQRQTLEAVGLLLDYSKQRITADTLPLLLDVARAANVEERRDLMMAGEHVNVTEDRAVLHIALRMPRTITADRRRHRRGPRGPRDPRPDGRIRHRRARRRGPVIPGSG